MAKKLNLKFTARDIAAVENALDAPIEKIISSFKLITLIQFVMVGLRDDNGERLALDEDSTFDLVDKTIKEVGKLELQIQVIEALIDAGFLPKALNLESLRKDLEELTVDSSKTAGETEKPMQS